MKGYQKNYQPCPICGRIMGPRSKTCGNCAVRSNKKKLEDPVSKLCKNPLCEIEFMVPAWRARQEGKAQFCSRNCVNEYQKTLIGEKNSKFTGRNCPAKYMGYSWKEARKTALARAGGKCEKCGKDLSKVKRFAVHHEIPAHKFSNKDQAHTVDNLKVICQSCHAKEHNLGKTA